MKFKLSPKPKSKLTLEEQTKEFLASLSTEEVRKLLKEVEEIKNNKDNIKICQD